MGDQEEILKDPLLELDEVEKKTTPETDSDDEWDSKDNSTDDKWKEDKKEVKPEKKVEPKKDLAKEKRHQEQEAWTIAEVKRLRNLLIENEVAKASQDANALLELSQRDMKLAREVAQKFDWSQTSRGSYDDYLADKWAVDKPVQVSEEEIEKRVEARLAQREHEAALVEAQALLDELPEEQKTEAQAEFDDLVEGRTLTREKALKIAQLVTLSLKKGSKKVDSSEALKKLSSTGISTAKKPTSEWNLVEVVDPRTGKLILLDSNKLK